MAEPNSDETTEMDKVWIKCRAREQCEGNYAKKVMEYSRQPTNGKGSFVPDAGGKLVRYQCLTCNGLFHINN